MARPSLYSPELLQAIASRLSKGEPLVRICADEGMPNDDTVRGWMEREDVGAHVSRVIARARELGFDAIAADTLDIADDARNDWMDQRAEDGDEQALKFNGEHVQRSKLRIETRLKLLAKWDPKRYGERQQVDHDVTGTLEQLVMASMPATKPAADAASTEGETE